MQISLKNLKDRIRYNTKHKQPITLNIDGIEECCVSCKYANYNVLGEKNKEENRIEMIKISCKLSDMCEFYKANKQRRLQPKDEFEDDLK